MLPQLHCHRSRQARHSALRRTICCVPWASDEMLCTRDINDPCRIAFQQRGHASSNKDHESIEIDVDSLIPAGLK